MKALDDEIREHFADLYAEDGSRAPQFSALWTEAERRAIALRRRSQAVHRWWFAAAAAAVIAAVLLVQSRQGNDEHSQTIIDPAEYPSILAWRPPTDGLLRLAPLAPAAPSAFGSVLDGMTRDSVSSSSYK